MSSWVHLELDTTAPAITFGTPTNTGAGQLLTVPYSLTDAGPASGISATVTLADNRVLTMSVGPTAATVLLPPDTPAGPARVDLLARDELLNEATGTLTVALTGTIVVPEPTPAPAGGPPAGRAPRRPVPISTPEMRLISVQFSGRVSSSSTIAVGGSAKRTIAVGRSAAAVTTRGPARRTVITGASNASVQAAMLGAGATSRTITTATITRRDGPDDVAALLALGLL